MKRLFTKLIIVLLFVVLSACNSSSNSNTNTLSVAELTERENAILATTADKSFVFDFETDGEYKEVSVWLEKYEAGELVDDRLSEITTNINENGSIIFSNTKSNNTEKQQPFAIGIGSDGSTGSTSGFDVNSNDLNDMASVWGSFPEELSLDQDELVLAYIGYSDDKNMSSLTTDFYENPEGNENKLEEYNVAYLLKADFVEKNN
ncbi:hypothetical protein [Allobacillus halotolerans]|uniref:Lipoprotein n=1 Tax=Allobacillus halotolerans TaxID=570278 RepID=A0ABS6GQ12_9BACI|nr:hypothetical protein [Allobacillus halotolerans]MBU6081201.1 hypothetical protein [Allobacillus halotolerans]